MKILLINLDRSPERLARMDTLLAGFDLTFDRVAAVDGKLLSDTEKQRWLGGDEKFYRLGPGEIGCFLSHRACWEIVAAGPDSHAVVLEDDVHIGADAGRIMGDASWIPADADIVKLETALRRIFIDKAHTTQIAGRQVRRLRGEHAGAGAYILSRKGAEYLLAQTRKFSDPVDHVMFNPLLPVFDRLVSYQLIPALCVQDVILNPNAPNPALPSDLYAERRLNRLTGFTKLKREIKRPFEQFGNGLRGLAVNLFTSRRWGTVPFR